jgi:hypothetical protein
MKMTLKLRHLSGKINTTPTRDSFIIILIYLLASSISIKKNLLFYLSIEFYCPKSTKIYFLFFFLSRKLDNINNIHNIIINMAKKKEKEKMGNLSIKAKYIKLTIMSIELESIHERSFYMHGNLEIVFRN